jgi:hypothetical protein
MGKRRRRADSLESFRAWQDHQYDPGYWGRLSPFRGRLRIKWQNQPLGLLFFLTGCITLLVLIVLVANALLGSRGGTDGSLLIFLGVLGLFQIAVSLQLLRKPATKAYRQHGRGARRR